MSVTQYACGRSMNIPTTEQSETYKCYDCHQTHRSIQEDGQEHDAWNGPRSISDLLGHVGDTVNAKERPGRRDCANDTCGAGRRPSAEIGEFGKNVRRGILGNEHPQRYYSLDWA